MWLIICPKCLDDTLFALSIWIIVGSWKCPISANNIQIIYPACTKVLQLRFFKQNYHQPGVNLVRPHDLYLVSWEHHTSSIPLKTWELIRHDFLHIRRSISSIQGIHEEFIAQLFLQPNFLTGSNSFWFALATASQLKVESRWGKVGNEFHPSVSTAETSFKLMEGSNWICFLASENDSWAKIVDCTIGNLQICNPLHLLDSITFNTL